MATVSDREGSRGGLECIGAAPTPEIVGHSGEERVPDPVSTSSVFPPSRTPGIVMGLPGCECGGLHSHHRRHRRHHRHHRHCCFCCLQKKNRLVRVVLTWRKLGQQEHQELREGVLGRCYPAGASGIKYTSVHILTWGLMCVSSEPPAVCLPTHRASGQDPRSAAGHRVSRAPWAWKQGETGAAPAKGVLGEAALPAGEAYE